MDVLKKYFTLIFIFIIFFVGINYVSAADIYNAHAGTAFNDSYKARCKDEKNCLLADDNKIIIQARLYYIHGGSFEPIGDTLYFVNKSAHNYLKNKKLNVIYLSELNYLDNYEDITKCIKEHITNFSSGQAILKKITGKSNYSEILNNLSRTAPSIEGYRIIIEPANVYVNPTFSDKSHAIITVKGLAAEYVRTKYSVSCLGKPGTTESDCKNPLLGNDSQAQYMYVQRADVGIDSYTERRCAGIQSEQLADMKIGCGYDIVDVNKFITPQICWQKDNLTNRNMTCKNTDENNVEKISETYSSTKNCSNSISERKMYSEYGTRINGSGTCNIYCIESAQISLPGNVSELKQKGSYFAWPTRPDDIFGKYSMSIKSTMKCTIKDDGTDSETIGSTVTMGCTSGYTPHSAEYCRSLTETTPMDCGSKIEINGVCYELKDKVTTTTTYNCCNSGIDTGSGCTYTTANTPTTCTSGFYYSGSCYSYNDLMWSTPTDCAITHRDGYPVPTTYCRNNIGYEGIGDQCCSKTLSNRPVCSSSYYYSGGYCYQKRDYDQCSTPTQTCPDGYTGYSANPSKCISNTYTEKNNCPFGYVKVNETCYKKKRKTELNFDCPSGYTMSADKTTCYKVCDKNYLIKMVENTIKNNTVNEISAKLTGGTNLKIDSSLEVASDKYSFDQQSLTFERLVKFKISSNLNRYYNKLSGTVYNDRIDSDKIFDRQEGVISLSKNDPVYYADKLIDYPLTISEIKVGTNNKFGKLLENSKYTCKYNLIEETDDCICPSGTKNAGMLLNDIVKKYCDDIGDNCADWKYKLCDSDYSKITQIEGCSNKFYCINPTTKQEVNITECVKNKSKNYNLEIAERMCELENGECTNDTICINPITKQTGNIKDCLEDGNSRESCEIKTGCRGDSYCTGECSWTTKKISNITYGYEKCNNNRFCGFTAYCNDDFKTCSSATYECVSKKLGVENIENALNSGISISKLENAVTACRSTICGSKEKIVFRIIDLNNPFPGKNSMGFETDYSNNNKKGRTPGSNWNSVNVVENEILNARGKKGYAIYTEKEPIIKITLTPNDIKKIRKYNTDNPYDDFKLKCVEKNTSGCISEFLHNNQLGLKIETIKNCNNLNKKSTLSDFNKCYNSNN